MSAGGDGIERGGRQAESQVGGEKDATERSNSSPGERPSSLSLVHFGFHAKLSHDADKALIHTRSQSYSAPPPRPDKDIWKRLPPDFRYVVYDPKPPKRNTVDSQQPWLYGTIPGQREKVTRERGTLMPLLFRKRPSSPTHLVTRFHIARPFTAKKQFVSEGMNPPGEYEAPKPHDFRQYPPLKSLGLDEFETSYERDPYGIHFKTDRLNTIHGLHLGQAGRDMATGRQMAPPMSAKPKWDKNLIIEKNQWPQKPAAFTRHRLRNRNQYSAFMERAERNLAHNWSLEKQEFESSLQRSNTVPLSLYRQKTSV